MRGYLTLNVQNGKSEAAHFEQVLRQASTPVRKVARPVENYVDCDGPRFRITERYAACSSPWCQHRAFIARIRI